MNKLLRYLLPLLALGGLAATGWAQPAPKILVIDLARALDNYYKNQDARAKLNNDAQKAQEQLDELTKQMQAIQSQYNDLMEQSKNPVSKPEVRSQAEADAQKKVQEFQRHQQEAQRFANDTRASLQQRAKNYNDILLEDIKNSATAIARARGATLVLDKGGPSLMNVPTVVYADASYDITDDVLKDLNKDKPATTPAPAAATAAPAAPAATSASPSQFSVPNVTPPEKKP